MDLESDELIWPTFDQVTPTHTSAPWISTSQNLTLIQPLLNLDKKSQKEKGHPKLLNLKAMDQRVSFCIPS